MHLYFYLYLYFVCLTKKGAGPGDRGGVALEEHQDTVESRLVEFFLSQRQVYSGSPTNRLLAHLLRAQVGSEEESASVISGV